MKAHDILQIDIRADAETVEKAYLEKLQHLQSLTAENEEEKELLERKINNLQKAKNDCLSYAQASKLERARQNIKNAVTDKNTLYSCHVPGLGWCIANACGSCCSSWCSCDSENLYDDCGKVPGVDGKPSGTNIFYIIDIVGWVALIVLGFIFVPDWIDAYKQKKKRKEARNQKERQEREAEIQKQLAQENARRRAQQQALLQSQKSTIQTNLNNLNAAYLQLKKREQDVLITMKIIIAVTKSEQLQKVANMYYDSLQADKKRIYENMNTVLSQDAYHAFENEFNRSFKEMLQYFEFIHK